MSSKTREDRKPTKLVPLLTGRCLGMFIKQKSSKQGGSPPSDPAAWDGYQIFQDWQNANLTCYWNAPLLDAASNCEYKGYISPGLLLLGGSDYYVDILRNAWGRRVLKPPPGFNMRSLGEVHGAELQLLPQTQFVPLAEATCIIVAELNRHDEKSTLPVIMRQLPAKFPGISVPTEEVLFTALTNLVKEKKIFQTDEGYFIVTPETYSGTSQEDDVLIYSLENTPETSPTKVSPMKNREEAIKGSDIKPTKRDRRSNRSNSLQREKMINEDKLRSSSLSRSLQQNGGDSPNDIILRTSPLRQESVERGEKRSLLSKLFGRTKSKERTTPTGAQPKNGIDYATFSAQFPPPDIDLDTLFRRREKDLLKEQRRHSRKRQSLPPGSAPGVYPDNMVTPVTTLGGITVSAEVYSRPQSLQRHSCSFPDERSPYGNKNSRSSQQKRRYANRVQKNSPLSSPEHYVPSSVTSSPYGYKEGLLNDSQPTSPETATSQSPNPMFYSCYGAGYGKDIVISPNTEMVPSLQKESHHKSCESGVNAIGINERVWKKYHEHLSSKTEKEKQGNEKSKRPNRSHLKSPENGKIKKTTNIATKELHHSKNANSKLADYRSNKTDQKVTNDLMPSIQIESTVAGKDKPKPENTGDSGFESPKAKKNLIAANTVHVEKQEDSGLSVPSTDISSSSSDKRSSISASEAEPPGATKSVTSQMLAKVPGEISDASVSGSKSSSESTVIHAPHCAADK